MNMWEKGRVLTLSCNVLSCAGEEHEHVGEGSSPDPVLYMSCTVQEKSMNMWEKGRVLTLSECEVRQGLVHGTCPGLVEGNEYMFRIKAVNIGQTFLKHIISPVT